MVCVWLVAAVGNSINDKPAADQGEGGGLVETPTSPPLLRGSAATKRMVCSGWLGCHGLLVEV